MAPRMQPEYHGTGDPGRYSLRTLRHSRNNYFQACNVDVSIVKEKEEFFQYLGLKMKRLEYEYTMPNGECIIKKINIPSGVTVRDCSILILGAECELCGKCFKCETDLNVHYTLIHRIDVTKSIITDKPQRKKNAIDACRRAPKNTTNLQTKHQKKIHLTLRIGKEVVARISMKRKYLKHCGTDTCTQTKLYLDTELTTDSGCESAGHIDPTIYCNSPCRCYNSCMHVAKAPNQYSVSNIVETEQLLREESILRETSTSNGVKESRNLMQLASETFPLVLTPRMTPPDSNVTLIDSKSDTIESNDLSKGDEFCSLHSNTSNKTYHNLLLNKVPPILDYNENYIDKTPANNTPLEKSSLTNSENNKDINENEIQTNFNKNEIFENKENTVSNMVQVVVPIILPIFVTKETSPSAPLQLMITSTQFNQQQERQQTRQGHQDQKQQQGQQQKIREHQRTTKTPAPTTEDNTENDIQEVLRIVRNHNIEINHESPTRSEQIMLLRNTIKDMKRMEEQGWHLLSEDSMKKMQRATKTKNNYVNNDECAKKKKVMVEPNSEHNVIRNPMEDRLFTKEHVAKMQDYNDTRQASNNTKGNMIIYNRHINIPMEVLQQYGINFCNEGCQINNNKDAIHESVSRFLVPSFDGMESRSNRPAVIDLVNDTEEY